MGSINRTRVVLGGLLAGVVMNVVEFVLHAVVLEEDWRVVMVDLGQSPELIAANEWVFVLLVFLAGILAVWLYAAIRPRYGAGPHTAVIAGVAVWMFAYLIPAVQTVPMALYPPGVIFTAAGVSFVEVPLATVIGAWLYKEA